MTSQQQQQNQDPVPSSSDFVNVSSRTNSTSGANFNNTNENNENNNFASLISSVEKSIQSIQQIASALAAKKTSAKPFLDQVEKLLGDLAAKADHDDSEEGEKKNADDNEENNNNHNGNDNQNNNEETEKNSEATNGEKSLPPLLPPLPKTRPFDENSIFCSKVADFIYDLHLDSTQCGKGVAALVTTSQTETVKIRKIARSILTALATIASNFLISDNDHCIYHTKTQHKSWHYYMHTLTQVAHTIRNAYNARRGFLTPGTSSASIPDSSDDHIGRWLLNVSASVLATIFALENIVIENLSILADDAIASATSNNSDNNNTSSLATSIDSRILSLTQIFFESILDLLATEAAKYNTTTNTQADQQAAVSVASQLSNANAAHISAELRGEAKACLFQIISRAQEAAPEVFDLVIRIEKKKESSQSSPTSSSSSSATLPLLVEPFLRVVCDRTGSDDEAQLACVKIMTSSISSLCEQQYYFNVSHGTNSSPTLVISNNENSFSSPTPVSLTSASLLNFALQQNSKFRVSLGKGLLFAIAAPQPLVLSAGLDTLVHLATSCLAGFGIELGELYCNVLLRLLDNQNAPTETRLLIVTHLRRLALQLNPKTNSSVLVDFVLCLELNPRLHHLNLIQQMISVLSKAVRAAQPQDLLDPSVNHYVTAFTARPHTAANVPFALVSSSEAIENNSSIISSTEQQQQQQQESVSGSTNVNSKPSPTAAANQTSNVAAASSSSSPSSSPLNSIAIDTLLQAKMAAAADTTNITLECFKTLCCIAHSLSFATTSTNNNNNTPPLSNNAPRKATSLNNNNNLLNSSIVIHGSNLTEQVHQISYCNAQQQAFQRQVDVINLAPLKTISQMFKIPLSLLKLPSDLNKTAAQVAEEAALEAALAAENGSSAQRVLTKEQTRELAQTIAALFVGTPSIKAETVSEFLGDPRPIASFVAEEVFGRCHFKGMDICDALSEMLGIMQIPKEGQRIERLLERFATAYWKANCDYRNDDTFPFKHEDGCFLVAVAVVMLNTDMYNPKITSKMTRPIFNLQLSTGNDDGPFPPGFTDKLYDNIRKRPLTSSQALLEPSNTPVSSPSSMIDSFFFSKTERKELVFAVERRRIVLESLILLKRKIENWSSNTFDSLSSTVTLELFGSTILPVDKNQYSHLLAYGTEQNGTSAVPVSIRSVAREGLSVAWPQLSATMNSLVNDASQNIGITVAAVSALSSLLHGAAVHELQENAQLAMSSLLRARARCVPLHKHVIQEILAVAASRFAPNLGEPFWSVVIALMREVDKPSQVDDVFASLAQQWSAMRPSLSVPLSRILAEAAVDLIDKVPPTAADARSSTELLLVLRILKACIDCLLQAKARINDRDEYLFVTEWPTIMDGLCKLLFRQSASTAALSDVMQVSHSIFAAAVQLAPEVVGQYVSVVNNYNNNSKNASLPPASQILIKNHVASLMTSIVSDPNVLSRDSTGIVVHKLLVNDFLPVLLDIMVEPVQGISGEVELKSRCAHVFSSAALNFCAADNNNGDNSNNNKQYLIPVCAMLLCATAGATDAQTRESCLLALKRIRPIFPKELASPLTFTLTFAASSTKADSVSATAIDVMGTILSCDEETQDNYFDWDLCFNFIVGLCSFGKADPATLCNDFLTNVKQFLPSGESMNRVMKGMKLATLLPTSDNFCKSIALITLLGRLSRSAVSSKDQENNKIALMFEHCLRPMMSAAKSPTSAIQAAQTLSGLFSSSSSANNNSNDDSLLQTFIAESLSDLASFTNLLTDTFLKGRPAERIPTSNLPLVRYSSSSSTSSNNNNTRNNNSEERVSLLLSAIPISPTDESITQALNRGGICSVISLLCGLVSIFHGTNNNHNSQPDQENSDRGNLNHHLISSIIMEKLCNCFDSLISLTLHVPSIIEQKFTNNKATGEVTFHNHHSSSSSSSPVAALQSLTKSILRSGIDSSDEKSLKNFCENIFSGCTSTTVSGALCLGVYFSGAFMIRDICLDLLKEVRNGNAENDEEQPAQPPATAMSMRRQNARRIWKMIHSKKLFGAATKALKFAKLNDAVAGYLEAYKEFELEDQE